MKQHRIGIWNVSFYVCIAVALIFHVVFKNKELVFSAVVTAALVATLDLICKNNRHIPQIIYRSAIIFVFFSMFLGKLCQFYSLVPHWDKYLHLASGLLLVPVGYALYMKLDGGRQHIGLTLLFCLFFSAACAGLWEIYEFTVDNLLHLHSQNGSLTDTMGDIIMGTLGALLFTGVLWIHLCKRKLWFLTTVETESIKK